MNALQFLAGRGRMREAGDTVNALMLPTVWALLPALVVQTYWYGAAVLTTVLGVLLVCWVFECLVASVQRRTISTVFRDGSTVVTAVLLGLAVTPQCEPGHVIVGALFAIVVAKHCYGGVGRNLFNPAMVGYAAMLVSFPAVMAVWPVPDMHSVDGVSSATPLALARDVARGGAFGLTTTAWVWINAAYLSGGLWLWWRGVIRAVVPLCVLVGVAIGVALFGTASIESLGHHLASGATFACAFFIATDPVSCARELGARWLYGILIGVLTVLIREHGGYPDGVAFAVLLANAVAPLLDRAVSRWRYS